LIESDLSDEEAAEILNVLDYIEGVDQGMYERRSIDTPKGEALMYTKCGNTEGCVEITDWMEWQKKGHREKARAFCKAQTHSQAIYVR